MISIVIPSSRIEQEVAPFVPKWVAYANKLRTEKGPELETEFGRLLVDCIPPNTTHHLEPILNSLERQTFRDFEVIVVRGPWWRYPDPPKYSFSLKVVDEKESIWHELPGGPYYTVANSLNTGVLYARGNLVFIVEDTMLLPERTLERAAAVFKENDRYFICSHDRYDRIVNGRLIKTRISRVDEPTHIEWRPYGIVELEAIMELNGFDETYDGAFKYVTVDFGWRLSQHSQYGRKPYQYPDVVLHHLGHGNPHQSRVNVRQNSIILDILKRVRIGLAANTARPTAYENDEYRRRHSEEFPHISLHEYAFAYEKVPTFELRKMAITYSP